MKRTIVSVGTTEHFQKGMKRLLAAVQALDNHGWSGDRTEWWGWGDITGTGWPSHEEKPYAFKAYALKHVADVANAELVLWCDACIRPVRSLDPLWAQIERDGYWIARNGWTNAQWCADSAYPDLFHDELIRNRIHLDQGVEAFREINKTIPHVVATSFGLNLKSEIGRAFLAEYYRLASETRAFCGPWVNTPETPCGPQDVRGHRHDQTAASVIAWRLGIKLTDPPEVFAYPPGTESTILLADGAY